MNEQDFFQDWLKEARFKDPELSEADEKVLRKGWNAAVNWMVIEILQPYNNKHTTDTGE